MCQFKSAIVLRNGDVLTNPYTDSHEELIALFKLRDNRDSNFARVEFIPEGSKLDQPHLYKLKLDEDCKPDWWTDGFQEKTIEHLEWRHRAERREWRNRQWKRATITKTQL